MGRTGTGRGCEGGGLYPEWAALGIREGSTPALLDQVGRLTALLPSYACVADELARQGRPLDLKVVHRLGRQLGAEVLTTRTRDLRRYRRGQLPPGEELVGQRVGVAIDGGRVRVRTVVRKQQGQGRGKKRRRKFRVEWREPKLLIIFLLDEHGRMQAGSRPWIDGTFAGPNELMELVAMHLHRLGAVRAELVTFVADGAPWIWERVEWVAQRVGLTTQQYVQVLDWCHAVHHISVLLQALDLDAAERQRHFRRLRQRLRAGQVLTVLAELVVLAGERLHSEVVNREMCYLEKHALAGRMAYRAFRQRGLPQGSGAIESTIRRVVNLRLKGSGLMWLVDNAEGVLVLRATLLSDRWQETLEHVQQTLAGDRRLEWTWQSPDMPAQLKAPHPIGPPTAQDQTIPLPIKVAA